jgi:hypothetical protein
MKIIICIALILYLISTQNQLSTGFIKVVSRNNAPPSTNNLIFYNFNINVILNN